MEQPPFVGDWVRKIKLGCGGFGIVTLWQNDKIPDSLGNNAIYNINLNFFVYLFPSFSFLKFKEILYQTPPFCDTCLYPYI